MLRQAAKLLPLNEIYKIRKLFRKNMVVNYFRLLSVAHITVNKVARPHGRRAHNQIKPEENQAMGRIESLLKRSLLDKFAYGNELFVKPLGSLGAYLDQSVTEVEKILKEEYEINTNKWVLSLENVEVIGKIKTLVDMTLKETEHIPKLKFIRYLSTWSVLQKIAMAHYGKIRLAKAAELAFHRDHPKVFELRQIQQECLYYFIFANGTNMKVKPSYFQKYTGDDKLAQYACYVKGFMNYTNILEADVLHSFWDISVYRPAYVIARDWFKKSITVCIRGTRHWADALIDFDFHYLKFSIMKDPSNNKLFLKFHYTEDQNDLHRRLGDDTRCLNGEVTQPLTGEEEVIETGYAHAGMLVSAVGAYKEITPRLEEILSQPEHDDFSLALTGHSLGGGMSILMVLLYQIHPIKALKGDLKEKLRGYSYGGALVLSKEFDKYMKDMMKSVIYGHDVVSRACHGSVEDICKILKIFEQMRVNEPEEFADLMNLNGRRSSLIKSHKPHPPVDKFVSLYETLQKDNKNSLKLIPMGRVFYIDNLQGHTVKKNNHYYDYIMREINEKEYFDELIFSRQLLNHHWAMSYEDGLSSSRVLYQDYIEKGEERYNEVEQSSL